MNKLEKIVLAIFIPFLSSRLIVGCINGFFINNWQYTLFEDEKSTMIFANCIMIPIIIVEIAFFYKNRKIHK